jgi:flavin reductase (DIM6/NTAB) family NADH-FMN oxidoreductase RutF
VERTEETRIDPLVFRRTLGHFASSITVITTTHEGEGHRTTDVCFTSRPILK